jgi:glycosyltransferase involved in cell wall biosynthesis
MRSGPERRVLFFHAYPSRYAGAQRVTHMLARELNAQGYPTRVLTPDDGPFVARLKADAIDARSVSAPAIWARYGRGLEGPRAVPALAALPAYWLKLARAIRAWRPRVLHCNDHRGLLLAGPAARLAGVPLVWHIHGAYTAPALDLLGGLLAARILVVSRALLVELPVLHRFLGKVEVLHNGIPLQSAHAGWRVAPSARAERRRVVCAARIHPDKGLDVLIRATSPLRERFPDLEVQIAGAVQDGYEWYARSLEWLRASLGLQETVQMLGYLDDLVPCLTAAAAYVQPSRREPFGLGVLEAMALGVPVVTTRIGGLDEIVEHGLSGLKVAADDPTALTAALGDILAAPVYAARLGARGRARVERDFGLHVMVARLLQVYRQVSDCE